MGDQERPPKFVGEVWIKGKEAPARTRRLGPKGPNQDPTEKRVAKAYGGERLQESPELKGPIDAGSWE